MDNDRLDLSKSLSVFALSTTRIPIHPLFHIARSLEHSVDLFAQELATASESPNPTHYR